MDVHHGTLIDQLTFYSSDRKTYGPYGGEGGTTKSNEHAPQAFRKPCLAWINGSVVEVEGIQCLKSLQFGWIDLSSDSPVSINSLH